MADQRGYSGWLGGYAKSVAGSVSAFTQDIIEETRHDSQDLNSMLKVETEKVSVGEVKIKSLEKELIKLKKELSEEKETRDVTELQLQEVGDRWRAILKEKDEEFKAMKDKYNELEQEQKTQTSAGSNSRSRSLSEIDFSDPFMCEIEIGRLSNDNQMLLSQLHNFDQKAQSDVSKTADESEYQSKISGLQNQLKSVNKEHQNELALKEQELELAIAAIREESQINRGRFSALSSLSDSDTEAELSRKYSELQLQYKREQGFFQQVEQEKNILESQICSFKQKAAKLSEENSLLSEKAQELGDSRDQVKSLQVEVEMLREDSDKRSDNSLVISQYSTAISNLNAQLATKTSDVTNLKSKLSGVEYSMANKEKEIHQLRIALNTVQNEDFQELRGLADSLKMQVDGYKESLKETGHKLLKSDQTVAELTAREAEFKVSVSRLSEETASQTEALRQLELQVRTKENFIADLQTTCSTLRRDLSQSTSELGSLTEFKTTTTKTLNQLKAEKLELIVSSKKSREDLTKLHDQTKQTRTELAALKQKPLFFVLHSVLTESQIVDIRDIVTSEGESATTSMTPHTEGGLIRDLRRKLADKSEQLRMLQGKISKLLSERGDMISTSDHMTVVSDLNSAHSDQVTAMRDKCGSVEEELAELDCKLKETECLLNETQSENVKILSELEDSRRHHNDLSASSNDNERVLEGELAKFKGTASKEKSRLLTEIERLVGESAEVEGVYSAALAEKESLECEMRRLEREVVSSGLEREAMEAKSEKASENLKKALTRLSVKDAKIEELSDRIANLETKVFEKTELVEFYKANQTDEYKAAQLNLVTDRPSLPASPRPDDVTPYLPPADDVTAVPDDVTTPQVEEVKTRLVQSENRCNKLTETIRDRDLQLDLLRAEVLTAAESSLTEAETNKLIDQNMRLQKSGSAADREVGELKTQNLELIHLRDYYQDQAKKFHENMENLRTEANKLINEANERENKSAAELERLQQHLLRSEQTHTEDYLDATRSEQDLRSEMTELREGLLTANQALDTIRSDSTAELEDLHCQVHVVATQRDTALSRATSAEFQAAECQASLSNLQIVLEQFQQDREGYASEVEDQYKRDLEVMRADLGGANSTIRDLQARVSEMKLVEDEYKVSRDDSKSKDEKIRCLQREVSKLDVALKVAQEGLQKVRTSADDKVERSLIKAFFTQYLTAPESRKPEVLRLMTSVLNYSPDELETISKNRDKKWLSNLLNTSDTTQPTEIPPGQSFSELFVSFLETEANRGSILGSRPPTTAAPVRSTSAMSHHHRSPSHKRSPSSSSNVSSQSLPVTTITSSNSLKVTDHLHPVAGTPVLAAPVTNSPLVVTASLAELLNKPR